MALSCLSRSRNLLPDLARFSHTVKLGEPKYYTRPYFNRFAKQCDNTIARLSVKNELVVKKCFNTYGRECSTLVFCDRRNVDNKQRILINGNTRFSYTLTKAPKANVFLPIHNDVSFVQFCTNVNEKKTEPNRVQAKYPPGYEPPRTKAEALRRAIKTYGPIILIFHISHSLVALGIIYLLVARGVDLVPYFQTFADDGDLNNILATTSTFAAAYALYKCTAPIRIAITLGGFSFVLRVLRRFGFKIRPPGKVEPLPTNGNPKK